MGITPLKFINQGFIFSFSTPLIISPFRVTKKNIPSDAGNMALKTFLWMLCSTFVRVYAQTVPLLPPQPLTPRKGMNLTNVALHFQFKNCTIPTNLPPYGCAASGRFAFKRNNNTTYNGLSKLDGIESADTCAKMCCNDNNCAVWNFNPDYYGKPICKTGNAYALLKSNILVNRTGWIGATRLAPYSWEATHCGTYEVQLATEPDFSTVLMTLPTLAYCCADGSNKCEYRSNNVRRCSQQCDAASAKGKCDSDTTTTALWHARPGIQSFWPSLFANVSGLWPGAERRSLLDPGLVYWRVRGFSAHSDVPTAWSESSHVYIDNDVTPRRPIRPITPARPLFHLQGWVVDSGEFSRFKAAIPSDLQPYTALVFSTRIQTQSPNLWIHSNSKYPWGEPARYQLLGSYIMPAIAANMSVLLATMAGPHTVIDYQSLAEIEWLFQKSSHVIGTRLGEAFWNWHWYRPGVQALKQVPRIL